MIFLDKAGFSVLLARQISQALVIALLKNHMPPVAVKSDPPGDHKISRLFIAVLNYGIIIVCVLRLVLKHLASAVFANIKLKRVDKLPAAYFLTPIQHRNRKKYEY
jgi:hypothetical protein